MSTGNADSDGKAGLISLTVGDASVGNGGSILLTAGKSTAAAGGAVTITAGVSTAAAGGALTLAAGASSGGAGGATSLSSGDSSSGKGGNLDIFAGSSSAGGAGGDLTITGGQGAANNDGGSVTITGGTHGTGNTGGDVVIKAGPATTRGKVKVYHQLATVEDIACTGNAVAYSRTCTVTSNALSIDLRFPGGTYELDPDACQTVTVSDSFLEAADIVMCFIGKRAGTMNTQGVPVVAVDTLSGGSYTMSICNVDSSYSITENVDIYCVVYKTESTRL
jgi:hypothetical protein